MVPDPIPFIFSWWNQPLSFQPLPSTYEHVKSSPSYTSYTLISQKFSLPVMSFSKYLFTKLLIEIAIFKTLKKQRMSCSSCPLPTSNSVRNRNMSTKLCYSNVKNDYAVLIHVFLTIHTMPNLSTEYLYFGFNFFSSAFKFPPFILVLFKSPNPTS